MKGKKKLEKAIVMGLLLSTSVYGTAWAEDNDIYYRGPATPSGDSNAGTLPSGNIGNIDIQMSIIENKWTNLDTSAALVLKDGKSHDVLGDVHIVNTIDTPSDSSLGMANNDALQVINGTKVNIENQNVYIASLGGSGEKERTLLGQRITARKKSTALSVGIDENNSINISGDNVKIIGNIDFVEGSEKAIIDGKTNNGVQSNTITLNLNSQNSYLYGDIYDKMVVKDTDISINMPQFGINFNVSIDNAFVGKRQGSAEISLSNGAEWIYDEIPQIENLKLDAGIVVLDDEYIQTKYENEIVKVYDEDGNIVDEVKLSDDRKANHNIVKIENLTGSGVFKANLDWANSHNTKYTYGQYFDEKNVNIEEIKGMLRVDSNDITITENLDFNPGTDYIFIDNSEAGTTQIIDFDASKAHLEDMKINEDKLYFANVADGGTSFETVSGAKAVYSGASNVYNYEYGVGNETNADNSTEFYVEVTGKSAEGNANYESAKGAMYAGYALGTELDTLNKRMGEARYLEDDNGVWVRYRHAKTGWDNTFETNSNMFQLGFDNEVQEDDGTHYRGVAVDYTDADTSLMHARGDGENKRYAVSLYDTWIGEKGHYRDLVLRGGRINSDYDISGMFSNGMEDIGGDYHQWFGSISAEWGRKNDMQSGWYFEPQTQVQLARVGGASYVSDSGIAVDQDGATSLIGRVGFRLGREYEKDNGKTDNYYFKADLMHEFMGDKGIALSTATERYTDEYDGQETWFDIGLGADISIGKNSFFWADVERTLGADFDNTWQINGGFRWEF